MNTDTQQVLQALRDNAEGLSEVKINDEWVEFASVYLDNVSVDGLSAHQIAGHYSALEKEGFYIADDDSDGVFGFVKLED